MPESGGSGTPAYELYAQIMPQVSATFGTEAKAGMTAAMAPVLTEMQNQGTVASGKFSSGFTGGLKTANVAAAKAPLVAAMAPIHTEMENQGKTASGNFSKGFTGGLGAANTGAAAKSELVNAMSPIKQEMATQGKESSDKFGESFLEGMKGMLASFAGFELIKTAFDGIVKGAAELQDATNRVKVAADNAHLPWDQVADALTKAQQAGEKLGFTNAEVATAYGTLITRTGDTTKASDQLSTAQDLARFKHESLADAVDMTTRIYQANSKVLKQLGIDVSAHAGELEKQQAVQEAVNRLQGQAADYADSLTGKTAVLKAEISDLGAKIGTGLVPTLSTALGFFVDHIKTIAIVVGSVTALAAAWKIGQGALGLWNSVMKDSGAIHQAWARLADLATGSTKAKTYATLADEAATAKSTLEQARNAVAITAGELAAGKAGVTQAALAEKQQLVTVAAGEAAAANEALAGAEDVASASLGPLGIALAGVATIIGLFVSSANAATSSTADLTDDITKLANAPQNAVAGLLATNKPLADFVNEAGKAGIGTRDLFAAYAGGLPTLENFKSTLDSLNHTLGTQKPLADSALSIAIMAGQSDKAIAKIPGMTSAVKESIEAFRAQNEILGQVSTSLGTLQSASSATGNILSSGTDNTKLFSQSANAAANFTAVFGGQMGTATTQMMAYIQGLDGAQFSMEDFQKAQIDAAAAAQTVADTVKSEKDAVDSARQSWEQSKQSVVDAEQSAASADRSVADSRTAVTTATEGVTKAEANLTKAQQDQVAAQNDLIAARATAQRQLEDLAQQVTDQAGAEESAQLNLIKAQQAVKAASIDTTKVKLTDLYTAKDLTAQQEQQYQLLLDLQNAQNAVNTTTVDGTRLRQDAAAADAAGVNGSAGVVAAQQKIASSNDAVSNAIDQVNASRDAVVKADQQVIDSENSAQRAHAAVSTAQGNEATAAGKLSDAKEAASKTIDIHTAAGRNNTDMLTKLYDADVKAGMSTDDIKASMEKAGTQIGISTTDTDNLITMLSQVPPDTPFDVTAHPSMDPTGLLQAAQAAGIDINSLGFSASAISAFTSQNLVNPRANPKPHATGGVIDGAGGPTEDNILIRASAREFMQPVSSVDYYGLPFMEAIRHKQFPRFASGGQVPAAQSIVQAAGSDPYVWGAVGPNAYDCSGLAGEVYAHLLGLPDYHRYFDTSSDFAKLGFRPGLGTFTIGVNPGQHMVGNLAGLGFEASSPQSRPNIKVGSAAQDVNALAQQWYLPQFGTQFVASTGSPLAAMANQYGPQLVGANYRLATYGALVSALGKSVSKLGGKGIPAAPFPPAGPWPPIPATTTGLGGPAGDTGAHSTSAAAAQAYAASQLAAYGWGPDQMSPLISLWNQESGWNANAVNASSGAMGIPQALGHGNVFSLGDYVSQIKWGLNYIRSRYGSPAGAWAHEVADNWYDSGGWLPPGLHNGTGRPEAVLTPDESAGLRAAVSRHDTRLDAYTIAQLAQAFVLAAANHPLNVTVSEPGPLGVAGL